MAILGSGGTAHAYRRHFEADFDVVLATDDPEAVLARAASGGIEEAALCNPEAALGEQLKLAEALMQHEVGVALLRPSVPHGIDGLGLVRRRIDGKPLLFLRARRISPRPSVSKRLFDVLFSAAVLTIGLPLWGFIALVIKLQDGGPVFFAQERIGAGGKRFKFIKFRTMWPGADRHRDWFETRHGKKGHVFKLRDDPRRTAFGRFLRRFSLDEVPQFLHALAGQMSVVGPRPPVPAEVATYEPWQRVRLSGWVGLTGLWQVCGRSEIRNLDDIVLLDMLYLHNHSPALDLRIILRTLHVVLAGRGAY